MTRSQMRKLKEGDLVLILAKGETGRVIQVNRNTVHVRTRYGKQGYYPNEISPVTVRA